MIVLQCVSISDTMSMTMRHIEAEDSGTTHLATHRTSPSPGPARGVSVCHSETSASPPVEVVVSLLLRPRQKDSGPRHQKSQDPLRGGWWEMVGSTPFAGSRYSVTFGKQFGLLGEKASTVAVITSHRMGC